jgi:superfamily II DNA helicase RecQ
MDLGENSCWALCVDYVERGAGSKTISPSKSGSKVDYRDLLNPADFHLFAKLRDFRKQVAAAEAVPAYMIFTNEQLAQIVQRRALTKVDVAKIDGIGEAVADSEPTAVLPDFMIDIGKIAHEPVGAGSESRTLRAVSR